jgi:hypothetical protein
MRTGVVVGKSDGSVTMRNKSRNLVLMHCDAIIYY